MKVSKYFFLILSIIFPSIILTLGCKNVDATTAEQNHTVEDQNSLLWKIEGKNLEQPSYLYGTIHMIGKKDFHLGANLKQIIEDSEIMVLELDMDDLNQMEMMTKTLMPNNQSIEDLLSEEDYNLLQNYLLDSLKISALEFNIYKKMKPILLSQVFALEYIEGTPVAFETEFVKLAKANEIEIEGLESVGQQIAFIDSIPLEKQAEMLMQGIHEKEESQLAFKKMVKYYKDQNLDSLNYLLNYEYPEYMEYQDILLNNRNMSWISPLEEYIHDGQAFIAVGAGHLLGENGLINLLRKQGYTVTPVETE